MIDDEEDKTLPALLTRFAADTWTKAEKPYEPEEFAVLSEADRKAVLKAELNMIVSLIIPAGTRHESFVQRLHSQDLFVPDSLIIDEPLKAKQELSAIYLRTGLANECDDKGKKTNTPNGHVADYLANVFFESVAPIVKARSEEKWKNER